MTLVCGRRKTFAFKHMAEELYCSVNGPRETLVKSRPSAARVKLSGRLVQWSTTSRTFVNALLIELVHGPPFLLRLLHRPGRGHGHNSTSEAPSTPIKRRAARTTRQFVAVTGGCDGCATSGFRDEVDWVFQESRERGEDDDRRSRSCKW
ncbi:protein kinase family protein [Striga asiatica]|uniref:Protein kinase family protein n=1 Tax=Striga asiatica TaxID=4170 RepID=A0A5A7QD75_STRAF|nr:protein kinase family protein [Striga asiatica]